MLRNTAQARRLIRSPTANESHHMRTIIPVLRQVLALALFFCSTAGLVVAQTSSGPGALADAFVQAWNTHDARAFGRLYADDADWITVGGERHKGRVAVEGALAKEHASWARTTTLRATDVVVRDIDSEHAIVMFRWEVARTEEAGATPARGNTLLVAAKQDGRWLIVVGQASTVVMPR